MRLFTINDMSKANDKVVLVDHWGGYISPINNTIVDQRKHRIAGIEDKVVIERAQVHHFILTHQLLCKYKPKYIRNAKVLKQIAKEIQRKC